MSAPAVLLETCRGVKPGGCPHAAPLPADALAALSRLAETTPVPDALADLARPMRRHEQFRLAVCACPNGCVRPQVADLGLVAARSATVDAAVCVGCNVCAETCPDAAIVVRRGKAVLDDVACLGCGLCARVCPMRAITVGPTGFRAFLGGRLGRRPRLGLAVGNSLTPEAACALAGRATIAYVRQLRPGLRFGDILSPGGLPGLPAWVLS
ncbi:4Fe-4S dicluster domain-containing protein [Desulfovibrio sp. TomC]|uniref:4Fe-4S dicluster domain-containing protein n=1 Tax=Desulfovibrio sp. TomC TaxID=1562888 RepID=UPI0005745B08|nr:4Fe-4S dicluster domain-containing protein [Desulfovibrio sp. TomC]KHK03909.1 iron-sulfur cluster-binding protein [Desulfovibrio sp. TomC]